MLPIKLALRRITLVSTVVLLTPLSAVADTIVLVCKYPQDVAITTPNSVQLIPRDLRIDTASKKASWDNVVDNVAVELSESNISFMHSGWTYSLSRITGEIRFYSPDELRKADDYRKGVVPALIRQGYTAAQAHEQVTQTTAQKFAVREYVGHCELATAPKF